MLISSRASCLSHNSVCKYLNDNKYERMDVQIKRLGSHEMNGQGKVYRRNGLMARYTEQLTKCYEPLQKLRVRLWPSQN